MSEDKELYERYVAAYDAAQRLHAREVEDEKLEAEAAQRYAAQGKALGFKSKIWRAWPFY